MSANCTDARVRVLRNAENLGVGGATMRGYRVGVRYRAPAFTSALVKP